MNSFLRPAPRLEGGFSDESVDVQRYVAALRRSAALIATIVLVVTVVVALVARSTAKSYQASATVVFNPTATLLQPTDATSIQRQLATFQALVDSGPVIARAAHGLSETSSTVKNSVSSAADPNANIITIVAAAPSARLAAARANAVASQFLRAQKSIQVTGLQAAEAQLQSQIALLKSTPGSGAEIGALKDRISALQISSAGATSQLQIGNPAVPPVSATSPKPFLDGVIAFVVSLVLAVLFVLGRDQLRARFSSPRELSHLLDLPVLAAVPYRRRLASRKRSRALASIEHEAYNALQTGVRMGGQGRDRTNLVVVTSGTHGEGKTTVTASLGRALARAGHRVLLISGDLRSPTLHRQFELGRSPGVADCLLIAGHDAKHLPATLKEMIRSVPGDLNLDLLDAGTANSDPGGLLASASLSTLLTAVRRLPYEYVLIDSAPILGLGDTQFMARQVDDILLVARLDAIRPDQAEDLNELIRRLELRPIGIVVVGAEIELSPYYLNQPASEEAEQPAGDDSRDGLVSKQRRSQSG